MRWFEGNIPLAIQTAKKEGKVLVVYITGVDDVSKKMDETWASEEVSSITGQHCIALKVEANSETCQQFSQIYPVVLVPSTYFIGTQGVPLEIIGGHVEAKEFASKLQQVIQVSKQSPSEDDRPAEAVKSPDESQESSSEASASAAPLEEKVDRAKELIEMTRQKKMKEEADKQLNSETARRQMGKEAAKLKQWQEDKDREETATSWKREREEDRLHKEKVKQQIARDRAERNEKFTKEKEDRQKKEERVKEAKAAATAQANTQAEAVKRETARIQFRLPDGSTITESFASSECLGTARIFLNARVGDQYGNFSMIMTYPRRQFTDDDMSSSLLQLQLAPSAALVIIPGGKSTKSTSNNSGNGGILMLILSPLILLWNFIYNLLFGATTPSPNPRETSDNRAETQSQSSSSSSSSSPQSSQSTYQRGPIRKTPQSQGTSRKEGNINKFRNTQDDDDETNTYNGNSTQQM